MATIKDVARLAGVSHGTVSNVLRRHRGVGLDKIQRVESAIRELGYRPTAAARSLKTSKSTVVAVVLPNIFDSAFAQLLHGVERTLGDRGFTATLYVTSGIVEQERRILEAIRGSYVAGLIIASCQPGNVEQFEDLHGERMSTVFVEREIPGSEFNFLAFNNRKHVHRAVAELIGSGSRRIALMAGPPEFYSEKKAIEGYREALAAGLPAGCYQNVVITNSDKESAFNMAFGLLQAERPPDAIVTTGTQIAEGLLKALSYAREGHAAPPRVVSLWSDSWSDLSVTNVVKLRRPYMHLGKLAATMLVESAEDAFREARRTVLDDCSGISLLESARAGRTPSKRRSATLKALLLESPSSYATLCLLDDFQRKTGTGVEVTTLKYAELYDAVIEGAGGGYDVCQVDIPWLPELSERRLFQDLDELIAVDRGLLERFIPGILDHFARARGRCYGIPYMYCSQLLFYRKDLFTNLRYQSMFASQHRAELLVPRSWNEFNVVARFFTRALNPESETRYGTTLGGSCYSGALCEYLPRLRTFGGETFDGQGRVVLESAQALKALRNYCESYRYASPSSPEHWWEEQVEEFRSGEAAMMVLFSAHAAGIVDRNSSRIVGSIGYDVIPGNQPLLGGYSLCISSGTRQKKSAYEFIRWACTELSAASTILGASVPTRDMASNTEVLSIFPWYLKAFDVLPSTQVRTVPRTGRNTPASEHRFEEILGGAVHHAITQVESPESAIARAASELRQLLKE